MSTQTPRLSGSTAESRRQARASARYRLGQVTPASQLATSRCRDLFFNRLVKEHCEPPCIAPGSLHASDGYRLSAGRTRHPRRGIWLQKASMRRHACRFIASSAARDRSTATVNARATRWCRVGRAGFEARRASPCAAKVDGPASGLGDQCGAFAARLGLWESLGVWKRGKRRRTNS